MACEMFENFRDRVPPYGSGIREVILLMRLVPVIRGSRVDLERQ